jgi:hypothetical protein
MQSDIREIGVIVLVMTFRDAAKLCLRLKAGLHTVLASDGLSGAQQ